MSPKLPANPGTISDLRPQANCWTEALVDARYGNRLLTDRDSDAIRGDLSELLAWDNYERKTSPSRESVKKALQRYLLLITKRVGQ